MTLLDRLDRDTAAAVASPRHAPGATPPEDPPSRDRDRQRFVSQGAAFLPLAVSGPPRDFYFLLLPRMTMLAFASAVEPLRIANQLTGSCLYRWFLLSEDGAPVRCSNGVSIGVDGALQPIGRGDTGFVCSGVDGYLAASSQALGWLRDHARHGGMVGGLCTGAFSLARAGLLSGRRFTLHWENQPAFTERFPDLPVSDALFLRDNRILTCGGGNAPVDMMIALIEEHHGPDLAMMVADMCLHGGHRMPVQRQRVSVAAAVGSRNPVLLRILRRMRAGLTDEVMLTDILRDEVLSRRQVERLFRHHLDTTPARFLRDLRLDRAHSLMMDTDMTTTEIAFASGFHSLGSFRKAYRARFGLSPVDRCKRKRAEARP